jgi:hypothetical protein
MSAVVSQTIGRDKHYRTRENLPFKDCTDRLSNRERLSGSIIDLY